MTILALLLMGFFASVASFFLKKSTVDGLDIKRLVFSPYLYLGGSLYVFSALMNLYLLKQMPYSIVVPMGALTYVWTLGIAHKFLEEAITKQKTAGIFFVLMGVSIMVITI